MNALRYLLDTLACIIIILEHELVLNHAYPITLLSSTTFYLELLSDTFLTAFEVGLPNIISCHAGRVTL